MSITLIVAMVLWVFASVQYHQIVHVKYVNFFYINYTSKISFLKIHNHRRAERRIKNK